MSLHPVVVAAGGVFLVLLGLQAWLLWRLTRMMAGAARLEGRVAHFADALSLLTETTEAGFRAVAGELTRRQAAEPADSRPRPSLARLKAALKRGRSIAEIAAAEGMSEGEVRLRLHLAQAAGETPRSRRRSRVEAADEMRA